MTATTSQPSFFSSFFKGSVFSILLLLCFAIWTLQKGPTYTEELLSGMPSVTVPVEHEETPSEDHSSTMHDPIPDEHHATEEHTEEAPLEEVELYKDNLVEESQFGLLPQIDAATGETSFNAYKRNFILPAGQHKFQLVLGPIGFSTELASKIANELPQDVSILLSPYSDNAEELMRIFKRSGHEVWLQLPVETHNEYTVDTGPLSLRADNSRNKNLSLYKRVMGRTTGYTGLLINSAANSTLSFSSARMEELQTDLYQRGLGLAYVSELPLKEIDDNSKETDGNVRRVGHQFENIFPMARENWAKLMSHDRDVAILYKPYPNDISMLAEWIKTLPGQGYVLAPLSAK